MSLNTLAKRISEDPIIFISLLRAIAIALLLIIVFFWKKLNRQIAKNYEDSPVPRPEPLYKGTDYESTVRSSFKQMGDEELHERKERGGLTQEAEKWANEELNRRARVALEP